MKLTSTRAAAAIVALLALHLCVAEDATKQGGYHDEGYGRHEHDDYGSPYITIPAPKITDISPNGQTYSELAQTWWQWVLRFNKTENPPLAAINPADCNLGIVADGDVLMIGGIVVDNSGGTPPATTRDCYLKKDIKSIFIPVLNVDEDTLADLTELNKPGGFLRPDSFPNGIFRDWTDSLYLRILSDGRKVHIPGWPHGGQAQTQFIKDNFYVVTPYFPIFAPKFSADQFDSSTVVLAAATGYHVLLDVEHVQFPLTLSFGGKLVNATHPQRPTFFTNGMTYNIHAPGERSGPDGGYYRGGY